VQKDDVQHGMYIDVHLDILPQHLYVLQAAGDGPASAAGVAWASGEAALPTHHQQLPPQVRGLNTLNKYIW
jgi:hypothetical protein